MTRIAKPGGGGYLTVEERRPTMSDYISREAALKLAYSTGTKPTYDNPYGDLREVVAVDDIENIPAADVRPVEWISVEDRLPNNFETVIVLRDDMPGGLVNLSWYISGHWAVPYGVKVTHWLPLPEPPKDMRGGQDNA